MARQWAAVRVALGAWTPLQTAVVGTLLVGVALLGAHIGTGRRFLDLAFWQQLVVTLLSIGVGVPIAVWLYRWQERREAVKEHEREGAEERRREALQSGELKRLLEAVEREVQANREGVDVLAHMGLVVFQSRRMRTQLLTWASRRVLELSPLRYDLSVKLGVFVEDCARLNRCLEMNIALATGDPEGYGIVVGGALAEEWSEALASAAKGGEELRALVSEALAEDGMRALLRTVAGWGLGAQSDRGSAG